MIEGGVGGIFGNQASNFKITFMNECLTNIDLYTHLANVPTDKSESIVPGDSIVKTIETNYEGHFRNGSDDAATLIEIFTESIFSKVSYNLNIIPSNLNPGFEFCKTLDECKQHSKSGIGFNTPVQITPMSNTNGDNCRKLTCLADGCVDAYHFPKDYIKKHSCPFDTDFKVTFCPSGRGIRQLKYVTVEDLDSSEEDKTADVMSKVTKKGKTSATKLTPLHPKLR